MGERGGMGGSAAKGGKGRSAQKGLDRRRPRGETIALDSFFGCLTSPTNLFFAGGCSKSPTGRKIAPANAATDFRDCSRDAAHGQRRTDQGLQQGRRGFQTRGDGRERRDFFGWGPTGCKKAPHYDFPRSPAGSGGRCVRQGRRTERRGRLSGPPVPKGGASLRAVLAAVGSGKVAPLPAPWRSFFARGRERFGLAAFRNPLP